MCTLRGITSVVMCPAQGEPAWTSESYYVVVMCLGAALMILTPYIHEGDAYEVAVSNVSGIIVLALAALAVAGRATATDAAAVALIIGHGLFLRRLAFASGIGTSPDAVLIYALEGLVPLAGMAFIVLGPRRGLALSIAGWAGALLALAIGPLNGPRWEVTVDELATAGATSLIVIIMFYLLSSTAHSMRASAESAVRDAELAYSDELTGLPNRRRINPMIERALLDARSGTGTAVVMFDLDHFKDINDTFGHDVGDRVLCRSALIAQAVMRPDDILGRWGGEEFIALLPEADMGEGHEIAERCRRSLGAVMGLDGVTASFGVTVVSEDDTLEDLLSRVDRALYDAKRLGRNQVRTSVQLGLPVPAPDPVVVRANDNG